MSVALRAGSTISHYRVISPLGAGGMGEVYMARDESLERAVALKVLPPELVKNEERVRRFVQEAKSASSLSHPNIVTIYEIGKAEVSSDGGPSSPAIHFIAMELITGDTLKHKIHHEKGDLRTLLGHLAQAAEGLAKAHSAGIVHRDLKPENIMISKDGFTKVLDFGLAKLSERADSPEDMTSLPTTVGEPTREGAIVGTINYMSPEQVRGRSVDHRSDVFSFGSILYEAATRKRPFVADSDVEIMHRILHDKPQPIEELNPEAPAALRRLVRRCLAKNPEQRFQSMKDLALELDEMVQDYDELSASAPSGSMTGSLTGTMALPKKRGAGFWAGAAVVGVVAVAALAFLAMRGLGTRSAGDSPYSNMRLAQLTRSGTIQRAVLSQDGKYLAYVERDLGKYSLKVKQVATGSDVQIAEPLATPFRGLNFSPDGNYIYFVNQETFGPGYSVLYQVPSLGGAARKLLFDIDSAPAFSPDGARIAFLRGFPDDQRVDLLLVDADGSNERTLASRKDPEAFRLDDCPWSPDAKRLATVAPIPGGGGVQIILVDSEDGAMKPLGTHVWEWINGVVWRPDGKGLVVTGGERGTAVGQVWFVTYPKGEVSRVTNDLNHYVGASITADNAVAVTQGFAISNLWAIPAADPAAARQLTFGTSAGDGIFNLTEVGAGLMVFSGLSDKVEQIWSMRADGTDRKLLTRGARRAGNPFRDPRSGQMYYDGDDERGVAHIWKMNPDGSHPTQVTTGSGEFNPVVTPDGQWLYYMSNNAIWKLPTAGGTPEKLPIEVPIGQAKFSSDGRWMSVPQFVKEAGSDRLERRLVITSVADGRLLESHPWPDRFGMRWMPGENSISFVVAEAGAINLWVMPVGGGTPRQLTHFESDNITSYDWSEDGKTIFATRGRDIRDVVLISPGS